MPVGELIGVLITIVLLTLLFRSAAAMGATLIGALVGVAVGQILLVSLSAPLGLPSFAAVIASMLGLGAGIDYALLIIGRYREQRAAGDGKQDAVARASAQSGAPDERAGCLPWYPYHRIEGDKYIRPSFFGQRTAVHQASIGCPFQCGFCGVISAYGSLQKMESPARTEAILRHLVKTYGVDSIQFYDNNFFLQEDHTRERWSECHRGSALVVRSSHRPHAPVFR